MRRGLSVGAAFVAALGLAACGGGGDGGDAASADGAGGKGYKVAYSNPVASQPGQQEVFFGFEQAASSLGWKASDVNANLSADKQVADIATMVAQKQDGIASWTLDPGATAGAYGQANAAGIPVIGVNSAGEGIDTTVWWEIDTCNDDPPIGRTAKMIADARPGGRVVIIGGPPVPSIEAQEACFEKHARELDLEIVAQVKNAKDSASAAQPIVADLLTKHGDVDAIWAYNDQTALGASAAATAAGRKVSDGKADGLMIFGQNGDQDAVQAVKDGRITGTWDVDTVASGWAMVKALSYHLGDTKVDDPPKEIVLRSTLWTKENVDEHVAPRERKFTLDTVPLVEGASH